MKFKHTIKLHQRLIKKWGDDLVYSLAFDSGKYILVISVHKSKTWEFTHGGNIQSCEIDDFKDDISVLANKIIKLYEGVLKKKEISDETE